LENTFPKPEKIGSSAFYCPFAVVNEMVSKDCALNYAFNGDVFHKKSNPVFPLIVFKNIVIGCPLLKVVFPCFNCLLSPFFFPLSQWNFGSGCPVLDSFQFEVGPNDERLKLINFNFGKFIQNFLTIF
jgi:hypothetical protein